MKDVYAIPGMVIDARGQIALTLLSEEAVGVSVARYDRVLSPNDLAVIINSEKWITVYRECGDGLFLVEPEEEDMDDEELELNTPQENEAAQFAIELALLVWPEWCPHYREKYTPKQFITFPLLFPEA